MLTHFFFYEKANKKNLLKGIQKPKDQHQSKHSYCSIFVWLAKLVSLVIPESKCIFIKTEQTVVKAADMRVDKIRVNQASSLASNREIFSFLFSQYIFLCCFNTSCQGYIHHSCVKGREREKGEWMSVIVLFNGRDKGWYPVGWGLS